MTDTAETQPTKQKVLIIDDDKVYVRTLTDAIGDRYVVSVALDGKEGLQKFEETQPDLVILDMLMPDVSGIGFLKSLQEKGKGKTTPILVVSNLKDMEEVSAAAVFGVRGYLVKSNEDLQNILTAMEQILEV